MALKKAPMWLIEQTLFRVNTTLLFSRTHLLEMHLKTQLFLTNV